MIALSSAEAELYGAAKGSSEAIGLVSMLKDLGTITTGRDMADASATLGIIKRNGIGTLRHTHPISMRPRETHDNTIGLRET